VYWQQKKPNPIIVRLGSFLKSLSIYETALVVCFLSSLANVESPDFRIACRTKYCRHRDGDGGDDGVRGGILRAFSYCKAYFILNLMQK
jgi:hypothetical protein